MKQNQMGAGRLLAAAVAVLALVAALFPHVIRPVCGPMPDGRYMACHYSAVLVTAIAAAVLLLNGLQVILNRKGSGIAVSLLTLVGCLAGYAVPARIIRVSCTPEMCFGLCQKTDMPCHRSFHTVYILLAVIALLSLLQLAVTLVKPARSAGMRGCR